MKDTITYQHDEDANINGTSKRLTIKASYPQLEALFGEPQKLEGADHSRVSWNIEFSDGGLLCIYDWNDDREVYNVTEWNVAANDFMTAGRIYDILAGRPILA